MLETYSEYILFTTLVCLSASVLVQFGLALWLKALKSSRKLGESTAAKEFSMVECFLIAW